MTSNTQIFRISISPKKGTQKNNVSKAELEVNFGIIDFGDVVYSWKIIDLAVGIAYAILKQNDPANIIQNIVNGYNQVTPLIQIEREVLFPLLSIRLCVSVCISAYQKNLDPKNKYLSISERSAWIVLGKLQKINPDLIIKQNA